jgi:hypothetical protein
MNIAKYLHVFSFFTTWNVILVLFNKWTHRYVNLLYLSFITTFVGLYLSFVNPRRFVFRFGQQKYNFTGLEKFFIVDITFHIFVFMYVLYLYHVHYYYAKPSMYNTTIIAFVLLLVYVSMINIRRVYGIPFEEIAIVFALCTFLYFIIF